jgi:hypothetical protein
MDNIKELRRIWKDEQRLKKLPCRGCEMWMPKASPAMLMPGQICNQCGCQDKRNREEDKQSV